MGDLFFLIKVFFMTVVVVVLMQIKIGDQTVEQYTENWIHESKYGGYLTEVAQGLVYFAGVSAKSMRGTMNDKFTELMDSTNSPGKRTLKFQLERSEKFLKEKYEQAQEELNDKINSSGIRNNMNGNSSEPGPTDE